MLSKKMKYTDYDGNDREETLYFNISKAELFKLDVSSPGGLVRYLETLVETRNGKEIMDIAEKLILMSYGVKSPDGRFVKSEKLAEEFKQTVAYDELFMELVLDAEKFAEFINAVLPKSDGKIPAPPVA